MRAHATTPAPSPHICRPRCGSRRSPDRARRERHGARRERVPGSGVCDPVTSGSSSCSAHATTPTPRSRMVSEAPARRSPAPVAEAARTGQAIFLTSRADYESPLSAVRSRGRASIAPATIVRDRVVADRARWPRARRDRADVRRRAPFDEDERAYLTYLAVHCAQGFDRARLYEAETVARRPPRPRASARCSSPGRASSSARRSTTSRRCATSPRSRSPAMADWCGVELVDDDRRLAPGRGRPRRSGQGRARPRAPAALPAGSERARPACRTSCAPASRAVPGDPRRAARRRRRSTTSTCGSRASSACVGDGRADQGSRSHGRRDLVRARRRAPLHRRRPGDGRAARRARRRRDRERQALRPGDQRDPPARRVPADRRPRAAHAARRDDAAPPVAGAAPDTMSISKVRERATKLIGQSDRLAG